MRYRSALLRAVEDGPDGTVEGYITTFGNAYDIGWGLREIIQAGAFDESMLSRDSVLPILYEHDHRQPPVGIATLSADTHGIIARTQMFMDDPRARAAFQAMQAGALREWSIGFSADEILYDQREDIETIVRGDLVEASVVLRGANPQTETLSIRQRERKDAAEKGSVVVRKEIPAEMLARISEPHVREILRSRIF